jgi:hypothetical protein
MKSYEVQLRRPVGEIPDARRREAMKTATHLEQWGAIRFRPLRDTMDWTAAPSGESSPGIGQKRWNLNYSYLEIKSACKPPS